MDCLDIPNKTIFTMEMTPMKCMSSRSITRLRRLPRSCAVAIMMALSLLVAAVVLIRPKRRTCSPPTQHH